MKKGSELRLSYNLISTIAPKAFQNQPELSLLELSDNLLTRLEANMFYGLDSLETLD